MPRSLLKDVDADGVDLVGSAANRRSFALFKAHDTQPQKQSTRSGDEPMKVKATKAAFRKHLELLGVTDAAELTDEALLEKAAAVGYELVEKTDPEPDATPPLTGAQKSQLRKFFEAIGLLAPAPDSPLDKSKLDPETRGYITELEKRVKAQEDARAAETRTALTKRATALQESGFLERDATLETLTEPEIAALEKAQERITGLLKKAGVLDSFGTVEKTDDEPATLREMVRKTVVDYLGREPLGKLEEVQIRKKIYEANPGLAQAVREEEKRERERGAA
jgi:hypothetical protein